MEALLRARGISPTAAGDLAEEYRLLANARESALAAVRIYNDPVAGYRTETFIVLMVGAWNSLLQAILERGGIDYYACDASGAQELIDDRPKVREHMGTRAPRVGGMMSIEPSGRTSTSS